MAAYTIVRFKYRFKSLVGRLILFAYLTPTSLLFIPLSIIVARLHLGNSLHGLIVVYLTFSMPLSTWLLAGYFKGVPAELEEQAMVDGATRLGALFRILIPLSLPGLVAVGIFTFTAAWNELLLALIFITSEDKRTVPLGLQYLITGDVFLWGPIMAGAVFSALPVDDPLLPRPTLHGPGHDGRLRQGLTLSQFSPTIYLIATCTQPC